MVDEHIVAVVRRYLRNLQAHGMPVDFAVVFGSQATASAGEWSDIDLVVVSPRFDARAHRSDVNLLWRLAARTDSRIEPIPCGERQWREDQVNPILRVARDSGARVAA